MSALHERGAIRWAIEGDELVVYVDADELADTDLIDVPEVAVLRIKTAAIKKEGARAAKNIRVAAVKAGKDIAAEGRRVVKRVCKAVKK